MRLSIIKKLSISFLLVNSLLMAQAQIQYGIKGGMNLSELLTNGHEATMISGGSQNLRYYPLTSVHGGVFASIPLTKKLSLQPELLYSMQGANAKPEINYFVTATENYRLDYLTLPVLLKYKLPVGFFVETGPQVGLLISAKANETTVGATSTIHHDIKGQLKSTDISWTLGAGYCSPFNVGFDIRYALSLSSINQATTQGLADTPIPNGSVKNGVFQIGVFYIFGKSLFNPPSPSE